MHKSLLAALPNDAKSSIASAASNPSKGGSALLHLELHDLDTDTSEGNLWHRELTLTNLSQSQLAFKILSTPADAYTSSPSCGQVESQKKVKVQIRLCANYSTGDDCVTIHAVPWNGRDAITASQWALLPSDAVEKLRLHLYSGEHEACLSEFDSHGVGGWSRTNSSDTQTRSLDTTDCAKSTSESESQASSGLLMHLESKCSFVRKAATEALGELAGNDDMLLLRSALACLEDPNHGVRKAAVDALKKLDKKGCEGAFDHLVERMCAQKEINIMEDLVGAIPAVTAAGDRKAIVLLVKLTDNKSCWVRLHCVTGLHQLANLDDELVCEKLLALSEDISWQVRNAAATAIASVAGEKFRAAAVDALSRMKDDVSVVVKMTAAEASKVMAARFKDGDVDIHHSNLMQASDSHEKEAAQQDAENCTSRNSSKVSEASEQATAQTHVAAGLKESCSSAAWDDMHLEEEKRSCSPDLLISCSIAVVAVLVTFASTRRR